MADPPVSWRCVAAARAEPQPTPPARPARPVVQVAGWAIDYKGLSFATVRAAGHQVPYSQRERAYHLFATFVNGARLE